MIEFEKVCKTYTPRKGVAVTALKEVSFLLPDTGLVFILGRSGSGKSTALHLLGGLDVATEGKILIDGVSTTQFTQNDWDSYRNESVGFVFQDYNLFDDFTIKKNIALGLELKGEKEIDRKVAESLREVGLAGYEQRRAKELSGGQKQRVAIARALVKNPKVILADEPTGALDSETSEEIFELLRRLSQKKLVVVVSHDREYAEKYSDGIIQFSDGQVVADTVSEKVSASVPLRSPSDQPKQHKMGFGSCVRLSCSGLKKHPIRMALTILLSFICFSLVGITDAFSCYNFNEVVYNSMVEAGFPYMGYSFASWSAENERVFKEKYGVSQIDYIYNFIVPDMFFRMNDMSNEVERDGEFSTGLGIMEASDELFARYDLSLTEGRMPEPVEEGEPEEILITEYYFDLYKKYGAVNWNKEGEFSGVAVNTFEDIRKLNMRFDDSGNLFKVVGIVDTNFKNERYETIGNELRDDPTQAEKYQQIRAEKTADLELRMHRVLFVRENYIVDNVYAGLDGKTCKRKAYSKRFQVESNEKTVTLQYISEYTKNSDVVYWFNEPREILSDNEAILPLSIITDRLDAEKVAKKKRELIFAFAQEYYPETDFASAEEYKNYIQFNITNAYHPEYTEPYFSKQAKREVALESTELLNEYKTCRINIKKGEGANAETLWGKEFTVAGFFDDFDAAFEFSTAVLLNGDGVESARIATNYQEAESMLVHFTSDRKKDEKLFQYDTVTGAFSVLNFNTDINGVIITFTNPQIQAVKRADLTFQSFSEIFVYVALGFAVFACVMFYSYIHASITGRKKEIGILRSLGARKKDVFIIFFGESILISLISAIFAVMMFGLGAMGFNLFLSEQLLLPIQLLRVGIRQIVIIFALSLGVAFLATFVPCYRNSCKKPIDVIKDI